AIRVVGKAKAAGRELVRQARAGSISWTVPDYNNEAPRPKLTRELFLAVSSEESAPISIEPAENKIWQAVSGNKLQVPIKLSRRGEFNEALKLKVTGIAALDGLKELEVDAKTNAATLDLDLGQQKLSPGNYTFYLQAQTRGKYRNNPEAAREADEAAKQAEKLCTDLAAEAKKASDALVAATKAAEEAAARRQTAAENFAAAKTASETPSADTDALAACDAAERESETTAEQE